MEQIDFFLPEHTLIMCEHHYFRIMFNLKIMKKNFLLTATAVLINSTPMSMMKFEKKKLIN